MPKEYSSIDDDLASEFQSPNHREVASWCRNAYLGLQMVLGRAFLSRVMLACLAIVF